MRCCVDTVTNNQSSALAGRAAGLHFLPEQLKEAGGSAAISHVHLIHNTKMFRIREQHLVSGVGAARALPGSSEAAKRHTGQMGSGQNCHSDNMLVSCTFLLVSDPSDSFWSVWPSSCLPASAPYNSWAQCAGRRTLAPHVHLPQGSGRRRRRRRRNRTARVSLQNRMKRTFSRHSCRQFSLLLPSGAYREH